MAAWPRGNRAVATPLPLTGDGFLWLTGRTQYRSICILGIRLWVIRHCERLDFVKFTCSGPLAMAHVNVQGLHVCTQLQHSLATAKLALRKGSKWLTAPPTRSQRCHIHTVGVQNQHNLGAHKSQELRKTPGAHLLSNHTLRSLGPTKPHIYAHARRPTIPPRADYHQHGQKNTASRCAP